MGYSYEPDAENDKHVVISSSEWLHMEVDVAELIVAAVNKTG